MKRIKRIGILGIIFILSLSLLACEKEKEIGVNNKKANIENWFVNYSGENLEGDKKDADLFRENKLTMINAWTTWCGPCVDEIKDLGELDRDLEDSDIAIKGLLVEDNGSSLNTGISQEEKKLAKEILSGQNAEYEQLLVSESLLDTDFKRITTFPTTYFVDSEGKFIGEAISGARTKDDWKKIIDERLEMMENK